MSRAEVQRNNKPLFDYIDSTTHEWIDEDDIINGFPCKDGTKTEGITSAFIETQSIDWLHIFYKWVNGTTRRTNLIKTKPIFLNQDRRAVSAFDNDKHAVLFLPFEDAEGYDTIYPELLDNEDTAEFVEKLGIDKPSLKDEIYSKILPLYKAGGNISTRPHFKKFFQYYNESCPRGEVDEFIDLIRDLKFVLYTTATDDENVYRGKASELYFPNENLLEWFKYKPTSKFVCLDEYKTLVGVEKDKEKQLVSFLSDLGVKSEPCIIEREISCSEAYQLDFPWSFSTRPESWTEKYIDGCEEIIQAITNNNDRNLSLMLWNQLLSIIEGSSSRWDTLDRKLRGNHSYFYRHDQKEAFDSAETIRLRNIPWVLNSDEQFVSPSELTMQSLSWQYDTTSGEAYELLQFLGIQEEIVEDENDNLTDEQRTKIELANSLADIPPEVLKQAAEQYRARKLNNESAYGAEDDDTEETDNIRVSQSVSRVVKEITKRAVTPLASPKKDDEADREQSNIDEDDYVKPSIDYSKKIEDAKERSTAEIKKILQLEELIQKADACDKYTYGWFKALLELEAISSGGDSNTNSREISISFAKVERETGSTRTLVLKHPNRYIPQSMEDLADIPLELRFNDAPSVKVAVEVVNVKSYTLRAKLRTNAEIDGVDLSLVTEARIEAKNPVFLLEELKKAFNQLGYDDEYNMRENLCENIEFVFGPPGTGKTTHLAENVILPIMRETEELKVLVLTPTNKAADVLTSRIMGVMGNDKGYKNWLVRFGATNDNIIEQSGVFRDKAFDIRTFLRNVIVTTIARFPYDYFLADDGTRLHLNALKWDYIIIDEASMIPLVNIIYPLCKKTPEKFIIAGDPFQIEPITSASGWKNENIYTMVELNSFTEPTTIPHSYHVELLTTQYRSVPAIGEIFSKLAYGGVLNHDRFAESQKPLGIGDFIDVKALNIIKFPTSKYESIYRPKRLKGKSNYQIYSAIFTFEFVKYLSELISTAQSNAIFRIGIIAPYRAQSDLIDKLMSSTKLPENVDVQVGTIHGFQGDECDIIISVFNPPPAITSDSNMFLNKRNIINVSISRARDYLFIIMPDDSTENVNNLKLIKQVEKLCHDGEYVEMITSEIENIIWDNKTYIEDNSFSTSHQTVNVYGEPERRYEVRSEDDAVDVQVHNK